MLSLLWLLVFFFFFQAEDGIRDWSVTGVQTCALPISPDADRERGPGGESHRDAARGLGRVRARVAGAQRAGLHAAVQYEHGGPARSYSPPAVDCDSDSMTPAAGIVAALLAFQTEGSAVAALPGTTRSAGLGGAGVALVGDARAVVANPARIPTIRHPSIARSYQASLSSTSLFAAGIAPSGG